MADDFRGFLKASASGVTWIISDFQIFCIYLQVFCSCGYGERVEISTFMY